MPTSETGNSTVCLVAGLIISSVATSVVVNSPSRLRPPYCTGTCSGAIYLFTNQTVQNQTQNIKMFDPLGKRKQNMILLTWRGFQQILKGQQKQTCSWSFGWRKDWSSYRRPSTTMEHWWTPFSQHPNKIQISTQTNQQLYSQYELSIHLITPTRKERIYINYWYHYYLNLPAWYPIIFWICIIDTLDSQNTNTPPTSNQQWFYVQPGPMSSYVKTTNSDMNICI